MRIVKNAIKKLFNLLGYELSDAKAYNKLVHNYKKVQQEKVEIEESLNKVLYLIKKNTSDKKNKMTIENYLNFSADLVLQSKSQIFQDLFVLYYLDEKKGGFFVEFGATNGITLSNTFLLEKRYQWTGILAEPAKIWQQDLKENRGCIIDTDCVWHTTGHNLTFNETTIAELSFVDLYEEQDSLSSQRINQSSYQVSTISLNELLSKYDAPCIIDYISIDTEGSEFEILQSLDFEKYNVRVITVEHNFTPKRELIFQLLTKKGYSRIFSQISLFDDWYVKE